MKIATYIAGDSNIVIPGLVSLTSIKYFNKNLDTFLFTDNFTQEKDPHINKIIKDNDIKIVKNHVINSICSISKFKNFDRWPRHVYYNYIAPIYLYELGYKYAIKVDYDILCLAEYDLQNILPSEEDILTIALRNKIINYISNPQNINFDFGNYKTVNAGFIFINLKQYKEKNILQLFKELYFYFSSIKSSEYIEQLALAAIQAKLQRSFKALPLEYNYRPSYPIKKNICNIHYNLGNKPWLCNSLKDLSPDRFKNMLLSNLWIKWANYIGIKQYIKNDEYHPFDFLIAFENIFNHLENISLLREYSLFIFNNCIVPPGTQININNMNGGGYLQLSCSKDGKLHYEILVSDNPKIKCKVALHFEGQWSKYFEKFAYLLKYDKIKTNKIYNEYYIEINNKTDIQTVGKTLKTLMEVSIGGIYAISDHPT